MAGFVLPAILLRANQFIVPIVIALGALMNIQLHQRTLSRTELERMVLANIRMLPGSQHAERVVIAARPRAARNWTVLEIEPPLSTRADNDARNAISALQDEFLLDS